MPAVRAGRDMNEGTWARPFRVGATRRAGTTKASPARSTSFLSTPMACASPSSRTNSIAAADDVQELVAVGMDLATMRWVTIEGGITPIV